MEYGLRRYEAIQRLWWFLFIIICLVAANFSSSFSQTALTNPQLRDLRNLDFWMGLHGIRMAPLPPDAAGKDKLGSVDPSFKPDAKKPPAKVGVKPPVGSSTEIEDTQKDLQLLTKVLIYLIRIGLLFLELKLLWLLIQYIARYALQATMAGSVENRQPLKSDIARTNPSLLFPRQALMNRINRVPLNFFLHPFLRMRLMLSGFQDNVSSEELFEKERRIVESDWQILYSSWGPFRWLFWMLPVLGLAQTAGLLYFQFHSATISQKEILDTIQTMPTALLPLIQAAGIVVFFKIAAALLRRIEELYLSNLDAFIYDRLLSRLPLQSKDTLLVLQTLQREFNELKTALIKLEEKLLPGRKGGTPS
ncbi:MAG: hypothetical protein LLG06_00470 [Desulfobacteraceae bacterium]|nr:hypothetical protein [Desulfobacteraceae bacterium]